MLRTVLETAQDGIGNFLVRALLALTAVAQKQDTRSGLGAGRGVASMDQLFKFLALIFGQLDMLMFAHAAQYTIMGKNGKI